MDPADAKKIQRAYRKVVRTGETLVAAKDDGEVVDAVLDHEKAKKSYGKALAKAEGS